MYKKGAFCVYIARATELRTFSFNHSQKRNCHEKTQLCFLPHYSRRADHRHSRIQRAGSYERTGYLFELQILSSERGLAGRTRGNLYAERRMPIQQARQGRISQASRRKPLLQIQEGERGCQHPEVRKVIHPA